MRLAKFRKTKTYDGRNKGCLENDRNPSSVSAVLPEGENISVAFISQTAL